MAYRTISIETGLLAACLALLAAALFGPALTQGADHHQFADDRIIAGLPYAMDVLSNVPMAIAGMLGLWHLVRANGTFSGVQRGTILLFFAGLVFTSLASSWYHLQPDDAGLAVDRYAMGIAFAALLGLAAARVSKRAAVVMTLAAMAAAPLAVLTWQTSANIFPWVVVQFGGMALVAGLAMTRPADGALPIRWSLVLLAYGVAKSLEMNDHAIYELSSKLVSGHSLKHLSAALAAWPLVHIVVKYSFIRHDEPALSSAH